MDDFEKACNNIVGAYTTAGASPQPTFARRSDVSAERTTWRRADWLYLSSTAAGLMLMFVGAS
uniref:Uncharacterized protein n=1 Tax=viral metagenome TaxID=1070528 RepID=A0A6C0KCA5_9ZZZZ